MTYQTYPVFARLPLLLVVLLTVFAACTQQQQPAPEAEVESSGDAQPVAMQDASDAPMLPPRANEARPSPNARVSQDIGTATVTVTYGRPAVKGREVFGGLEEYGAVWRAGANEATVFAVTDDVTIEGQPLPAGVYGFFAIPNEDEWTLIFNNQAAQWGAFDYDESQDALRVTVQPEEGPQQEWLQYSFEDLTGTSARAVLHWDTVRVPFTIAVQ